MASKPRAGRLRITLAADLSSPTLDFFQELGWGNRASSRDVGHPSLNPEDEREIIYEVLDRASSGNVSVLDAKAVADGAVEGLCMAVLLGSSFSAFVFSDDREAGGKATLREGKGSFTGRHDNSTLRPQRTEVSFLENPAQHPFEPVPIDLLIDPPEGTLASRYFTGIAKYPYRQQPFTVWVRGETVGFMTMEARARKKLLPEIEKPSEAVQEWVDKHAEDVVETAEELSEGGTVDVPTAEVVSTGLLVEPEEPRFQEIVQAAAKILEKHPRVRKRKRRSREPRKAHSTDEIEGADGVSLAEAEPADLAPVRDSDTEATDVGAETPAAESGVDVVPGGGVEPPMGSEDGVDQALKRLRRSHTLLNEVLSQPLIQILATMRLFGFQRLRKIRREIKLAANAIGNLEPDSDQQLRSAVGRHSDQFLFVDTVTLRTAHDVYQTDNGYLVESHIRRDPERTRSQRVSAEAVAAVRELLTVAPRDIATLAHRVRASGPKNAGFLYDGGRELGFEVQRALLVLVAQHEAAAMATPRGFAFRLRPSN